MVVLGWNASIFEKTGWTRYDCPKSQTCVVPNRNVLYLHTLDYILILLYVVRVGIDTVKDTPEMCCEDPYMKWLLYYIPECELKISL